MQLLKLTKLPSRDRDQLVRKTQKYMMEENLDKMQHSGKPFFWVELEKLRKMKQFCEN